MPTTEEEPENEECVKVIGNEILFKKAELVGYEPQIRVHVMSEGGDIFSGLNIMNVLERSRVRVVTIAQGSCCSAATFILLGGSERRMGRNAYVLIHQISTEFWGNFQDLKTEMKSTEKFMKMLKKMYLTKTRIPEKKFKKLMKKDLYLSPDKCLKYKIVDAVDWLSLSACTCTRQTTR